MIGIATARISALLVNVIKIRVIKLSAARQQRGQREVLREAIRVWSVAYLRRMGVRYRWARKSKWKFRFSEGIVCSPLILHRHLYLFDS
jgi:hypothetical protein